jgi:PAS domain-containing protein
MVKRADLATLLVDDLQRLPFHRDGWRRFATRLGTALHGPVILGTVDLPGAVPVRTDHVLVDEAAMKDYAAHYYSLSPWRQWTETAPLGAVAGGAAINPLPPELYENTQFYADFLRPNHMHHGLSARICRDARQATDLAVLRPRDKGPMTEAELRLVRYLMPHVRRALRVRHALGGADLTPAGLLRPDVGVIVVDRLGRVLFANPAAHERLIDSDGLTTAWGGVLTAMHPPAQPRLRALVRYAADGVGPFTLRGGGDMLLPRPGRTPLRVTIVAAPETGPMGPAALLLLRDPPAPPAPVVFRRFDPK